MSAPTTAFQFTEKMRGFVSFEETEYQNGYRHGETIGTSLIFQLTIRMEDIDKFVDVRDHEAEAVGYIECQRLGGRRPVERGRFNLFVETADQNKRHMLYRLFFRDGDGRKLTLSGFKHVQDNVGLDMWKDTTTLYVNLFNGHLEHAEEASAEIVATGILKIEPLDFVHQLTTFRAYGESFSARLGAYATFGKLFAGSLWDVYGPAGLPKMDPYEREIPLYTTEGVKDAEITVHPYQTADKLGLSLTRFCREPCDDVVVIIHGLTTSTDMFIMPEHYNLVQFLLDKGFTDVWTLDFRMSNRFSYNLRRYRHNMDDIALFDFPAGLAKVREHLRAGQRIHVICHCLGSVSFMMSLFGKAVAGVTSVISNSVALTPRVPAWSRVKLTLGPFFVENLTSIEYVNPYWRREPGFGVGKLLSWIIGLYHRECNVPECHMLSFMWGTGFPAVYRHENLLDITHRRGGDLYGGVGLHYYRHVRKMVAAAEAVKFDPANPKYMSLPDRYLQYAGEIETPVLFITGEMNNIFRDSNIVCHERLEKIVPGRHELQVFPDYGHQDVFMGKNNHIDIFPRLLEYLEKHRGS
jgi:cholesterol oxidase